MRKNARNGKGVEIEVFDIQGSNPCFPTQSVELKIDMICKILIDITESQAQGVTLKFEDAETVSDALIKIVAKLKLKFSNEEIVSKYALVLRGMPNMRYFPLDRPLAECVTPDILKVYINSLKYFFNIKKILKNNNRTKIYN